MSKRRRKTTTGAESAACVQVQRPVALDQRAALITALLATLTAIAYASAPTLGFVRFDDPTYITENPHVLRGLSGDGIRWAFATGHGANWHPLTWLSHMLDVQLFGPAPGPQHVVNVALHIANTILLFLCLARMTGMVTRSTMVAALFAVHPLHVESVAWISERKDVLSTFFWLLTMMAYTAYVEKPGARRYIVVIVLFALGLLSKPRVVTLPFALLLLDVWPLRRIGVPYRSMELSERRAWRSTAGALLQEKLPLIALAVGSSLVTVLVQRRGGAVGSLAVYPLELRVANAVVSYVAYVGKAIWPSRLSAFYPYPSAIDLPTVGAALVLLVVATAFAVRAARRYPYVFVGWLWYLGTLVPVIGIVQVGLQSRADRYAYVPLIGLLIVAVWATATLTSTLPRRRIVLSVVGASVVGIHAIIARRQTETWRDSFTLWQHAADVIAENDVALYNLGVVLTKAGRTDEGVARFREALRINPNYSDVHVDLGNALAARGETDAAIAEFAAVVRLRPDYAEARTEYGRLLASRGRTREAIAQFRAAIRLQPNAASPHNELGNALASESQLTEALAEYREAARLDPQFAEAHNNLGAIYAREGKGDEAVREFLEALRLKPNNVTFHYNAAMMLEQQRRIPEAIQHLEMALKVDPNFAPARRAVERLKPSGGDT